jgi:hypothetical protein
MHIAAWFPEADISITGRVLGIWLECADFPVRKLREKPWIFGPEEPDIGDRVENHSDTLEAEAKCPTHFVRHTCQPKSLIFELRACHSQLLCTCAVKRGLQNDATAKDLEPFAAEENLDLVTGTCKWEICFYPPDTERVAFGGPSNTSK